MDETWTRWEARIGSLKSVAMFALIFIGIGALFAGGALFSALKNSSGPQRTSLAQLVDGAVGTGKHVTVNGFATLFDAYVLEEDGKQTATYFFLVDRNAGDAIVVKAKTATTYGRQPGDVAFSGMTRSIPTDLKNLITEDIPDIQQAGMRTTTALYVHEGATPPSLTGSVMVLLILGIAALLCLATVPFPSTVFAITPLPAPIPQALPKQRPPAKATGRFVQLASVDPIQVGKNTRKFANGTANIVPLAQRSLMIYIHHILKTKTYGITIRTQETDWGAFITGDNVQAIEAGTLYGWKDRPSLRFAYRGQKGREEELFLIFDHPQGLSDVIAILDRMGFAVQAA